MRYPPVIRYRPIYLSIAARVKPPDSASRLSVFCSGLLRTFSTENVFCTTLADNNGRGRWHGLIDDCFVVKMRSI